MHARDESSAVSASELYFGTNSAALLSVTRETQAQSTAKFNVTQRSYDSMRTGWNQHETKLTVANVRSSAFQHLAQIINLDGQIDAQPLLRPLLLFQKMRGWLRWHLP
jgi:hypothetical protein